MIEASAPATDALASVLEIWTSATGIVSKCSSEANVNSPSTRATATKAAERTPVMMLGSTIRAITVNQLAPRERAASARVNTSIADSAESIDR